LINASTIVSSRATGWRRCSLIWLPIGLLAAWRIGRPYKVGPATLVASAIILDAG
jgi:hypothetical protein